ncbi:MAG: SMC-Scp complex subunit ScpB [Nitrospinae bacterium]|nr:SMC-Scp complex subunit ScpB [Nitrospinota bacterium]
MEREELKAIIENILLAADQPVSVDHLQALLTDGTAKAVLRSILEELVEEYKSRNLQVMEVAEGYQLLTRHDYSDWVRKFLKLDKTAKLTQPSLDTLAIIAYKQPLTRAEVEEIRGVDSSGVVRTLMEKKIIAPGGRKKVPGRPIMYRTTRKFLEYFGLKDLSDLPTLEDFKESELSEDQDSSDQTTLLFDDQASVDDVEAQPVEPADPDSSPGS